MADAHRLRATLIAPVASRWLREAHKPRVLHVFKLVCNLADSKVGVLSLVAPGVGPGPFAAVVEPPPGGFARWLDHHATVSAMPDEVAVGPLHIDCSPAESWDPILSRFDDPPHTLSTLPSWIADFLSDHAAPDSPFLAPDTRVSEALADLDRGLAEGDSAAFERAAISLAGLGPGLTPSGDDYLVGVLFGLWVLYPAAETQPLREAILNSAVNRTTTLSSAWLNAAARGEANAPWKEFVAGLERDTFMTDVAHRIIDTGHTSGTDALMGFARVVQTLLN